MGKRFLAYGQLLASWRKPGKGSFAVFRGPSGNYYTADGLSFFRRFLARPLPGNAPAEPDARTGGVVFPAYRNPPVWALSGGRVLEAGWAGPLGRRVVIEHEDGIRATYYQLGSIASDVRGESVTVAKCSERRVFPEPRRIATASESPSCKMASGFALCPVHKPLEPISADAMETFSRQVKNTGAFWKRPKRMVWASPGRWGGCLKKRFGRFSKKQCTKSETFCCSTPCAGPKNSQGDCHTCTHSPARWPLTVDQIQRCNSRQQGRQRGNGRQTTGTMCVLKALA
jgi:hypothetical protein